MPVPSQSIPRPCVDNESRPLPLEQSESLSTRMRETTNSSGLSSDLSSATRKPSPVLIDLTMTPDPPSTTCSLQEETASKVLASRPLPTRQKRKIFQTDFPQERPSPKAGPLRSGGPSLPAARPHPDSTHLPNSRPLSKGPSPPFSPSLPDGPSPPDGPPPSDGLQPHSSQLSEIAHAASEIQRDSISLSGKVILQISQCKKTLEDLRAQREKLQITSAKARLECTETVLHHANAIYNTCSETSTVSPPNDWVSKFQMDRLRERDDAARDYSRLVSEDERLQKQWEWTDSLRSGYEEFQNLANSNNLFRALTERLEDFIGETTEKSVQ